MPYTRPLGARAASTWIVRPPPQPTSSIVNDGSIRTCSRPQSVSEACDRFMRPTTARPSRPLGLRTWFDIRTV